MKKIVFIGSVDSSQAALQTLIDEGIQIELVCSLDERYSSKVSDYYPLHVTAGDNNIPYLKFKNINEETVITKLKSINPDYIFVIGLSQLIKDDLIKCASNCVVGFHPTKLPQNRGRAALPWMILMGLKKSSITFFKIDQGMDSGDILFQKEYIINETDYAEDLYTTVTNAMCLALKENIKLLLEDQIITTPQDEEKANYLLIRRPNDGLLDWGKDTNYLLRIIRATSHPYPGAFSFINGKKIKIYRAEKYELEKKYTGYNGQIADMENNALIVLTIDGALKITEYTIEDNKKIFVGNRLIGGYDSGYHGLGEQ